MDKVTITLPFGVAVQLFHMMWTIRDEKLEASRSSRVAALKPDWRKRHLWHPEEDARDHFQLAQDAETVMDAIADVVPMECLE